MNQRQKTKLLAMGECDAAQYLQTLTKNELYKAWYDTDLWPVTTLIVGEATRRYFGNK